MEKAATPRETFAAMAAVVSIIWAYTVTIVYWTACIDIQGGVIVAFSISLLSFANDLKANNHLDGPAFLTIILLYFTTAGGSLFIAVVVGILAVLPQRETSSKRHKFGIALLAFFLSIMLLAMLAGLIFMSNSIIIDDAGEVGRFRLNSAILYPLISALMVLLAIFLFWLFRSSW